MSIFISGGAGYIGSHTSIELLNAGHDIVIFDNFTNSHPEIITQIECITNRTVTVVNGDIRNQNDLETVFKKYNCTRVIHFAGLKAVGKSVIQPLTYYDNNVKGTLCLLSAMRNCGIKTIVFSSSACVYGVPVQFPITEDHPLSATNPYGRTKIIIEEMLRDLHQSDPSWRIGILRYFNPAGAHPSGLIGENPQGTPDNLMPYISQVAIGKRNHLNIYGKDYSTPDGTGIRDYIHVVDLAIAHRKALERLDEPRCFSVNVGSGIGYSVFDVIKAFENASCQTIPYTIAPRRPGDIAICYADPTLAKTLLDWRAERCMDAMCADHWRWQLNHANHFK